MFIESDDIPFIAPYNGTGGKPPRRRVRWNRRERPERPGPNSEADVAPILSELIGEPMVYARRQAVAALPGRARDVYDRAIFDHSRAFRMKGPGAVSWASAVLVSQPYGAPGDADEALHALAAEATAYLHKHAAPRERRLVVRYMGRDRSMLFYAPRDPGSRAFITFDPAAFPALIEV